MKEIWGVPPSGSGHSPKGEAAISVASPAKPSVPNAAKTAFLCKLMSIDFETRNVTLRIWNTMPPISSGFYVVVSLTEWNELKDRAASATEAKESA